MAKESRILALETPAILSGLVLRSIHKQNKLYEPLYTFSVSRVSAIFNGYDVDEDRTHADCFEQFGTPVEPVEICRELQSRFTRAVVHFPQPGCCIAGSPILVYLR
ncbi:hypothetical protein ACJJTC_006694 [Scirpophaga incertulas]